MERTIAILIIMTVLLKMSSYFGEWSGAWGIELHELLHRFGQRMKHMLAPLHTWGLGVVLVNDDYAKTSRLRPLTQ